MENPVPHWILEVARAAAKKSDDNPAPYEVVGELIQDGDSLNKQRGYQEAFGFPLMKGKPIYFFNNTFFSQCLRYSRKRAARYSSSQLLGT